MKSKNIGIIHYQVGHTDGVSLEIEKWQCVFEEMGHHVHLCAGDLGSAEGTLIPEMYHHLPDAKVLAYNTFKELKDFDELGYSAELERQVALLTEKFREFVVDREIDVLIAQNVWCVGASLGVAVALEKIRQEFDLPAIAHHHDFYWERGDDQTLTCEAAVEVAESYLPPTHPKIQHVVINSLAQKALKERKNLDARIIPNIFDFDAPAWAKDEYNKDFREAIGLDEDDWLILQATRIVERKGIELAIDVLAEMGKKRAERIVLVLAGYARDDASGTYVQRLQEKADRLNVELLFIEDWIDHERGSANGHKIYSLWDAYVFADLVSYPSLWEGWGNQFLEAVRAELPIMLFEYPVYSADIGEKGFDVISLGTEVTGYDEAGLAQVPQALIEQAVLEVIELLENDALRERAVKKNIALGREYYSLDTLRKILGEELS
ncbi:MAG: glycosyltransferase family 4 protein [Anaerolineae bacterium]|jgi:glycosyltransferase involved in cell wall biosynthesis|nr:glycosyltransferase family 4 protein [Anaerolineae bacterium]MBT7188831.1 glycosyltransferase family 4 protein [Anaerolineae bacterium]MBT7989872.1 glycosyltransferase family 4 protein [Anaerolineae bacterium]